MKPIPSKRHKPPQWVQGLFLSRPSEYYDHWGLFWSEPNIHMCYEVILCEIDSGFELVFGSCNMSYAGNPRNWQRCNMGKIEDMDALRGLCQSMIGRVDGARIWRIWRDMG